MEPLLAAKVTTLQTSGGIRSPLVVTPKEQVDINQWFEVNKDYFNQQLNRHGAILLRGFDVRQLQDFEVVMRQLSAQIEPFDEESSPRHSVKGAVHTATDYPKDYPIQFHNEFSYSNSWPMKIAFYCRTPADNGGETPIADSRAVLAGLSEKTKAKFAEKGVLYKRTYSANYGVSWQHAFATDDRSEVVEHCARLGIETHWEGDVLHTSQTGQAIVNHPHTNEPVWFNHSFFFNPHSLEPLMVREMVLSLDESELLTNTCYGDGEPIELEVIEEIRQAYRQQQVKFPWQAGDILILDNMLCAHSRAAFAGDRELFTIMSDKFYRSQLN